MSRVEPIAPAAASPEVQAIYDEIEAAFGMVPNLFKTYAHYPPLLSANWAKTKALMADGSLPRQLKELIALVVSEANACRYCVAAHSMMLQQLGFSPERLEALQQDLAAGGLTELEQSVLAVCRRATTEPHRVADAEVTGLRQLGLTDAQIVEALGVMELFTGYNKFLDALAVDLDF